MTSDEWFSLVPGSIVCNKNGSNHRVVLFVSESKHAIFLPSQRGKFRQGKVCYVSGDKHNFLLVKARVRLKQVVIDYEESRKNGNR